MNINKKISEILENCSYSKGIVCTVNLDHELGTKSNYLDDYLAIKVLADMLKENKAVLSFRVGREDEDMKYLLKLLGEKENG